MKKKDILFNILVFVGFTSLVIILVSKSFQNDTFYYLKVGESISKYGIDMKDHFSFIPNLKYTYPHALFDLLLYFIYHFLGFSGVYLFVIITSLILAYLMYYTTNNLIKDKGISFFLTSISMGCLSGFLAARSQLVSYIFLLLILFFIEKLRDTGKKKYIFYMIIPCLLLTNMHAAIYPIALILFLPFLVSDLVSFIKEKYSIVLKKYKEDRNLSNTRIDVEKAKNTKLLLIALLVVFFTGFISLTPDAYTYVFKISLGDSMNYIAEHKPITIENGTNIFIIMFFIMYLLLLGNMKIKLRDLFMLGGLLLLSFMSIRSIALFAILSLYSIARLVKVFIDKRLVNIKIQEVFLLPNFYAILLLLFVLSSVIYLKYELKKEYVNEESFPVEMATYIKENINQDEMRLFNEYNYGSYLLFRDIKVLVDSRCDLYLDEFNKGVTVFDDVLNVNSKYKLVFDKYDITHIILHSNSSLNTVLRLDPNYIEIHSEGNFSLYEKVN